MSALHFRSVFPCQVSLPIASHSFFADTAQFKQAYISIHPKMVPAPKGIYPTGPYAIYCLHATYGTSHFILKQDDNCDWITGGKPPFIDQEFITPIGEHIEASNK